MKRKRQGERVTVGVIGGSGLYDMEGLTSTRSIRVRTPFGPPCDAITGGELEGVPVAFLSRHGRGHLLNPSGINYRANIFALKSMGADEDKDDKITFLMGIDGARFRRPVVPGDRLELRVEVTKRKASVWRQKGTALVDGQVVAEAEFLAMLADREQEK